jgi:hypothetical protein
MYVNWSAELVAVVPAPVVTLTSTTAFVPASAGDVAVIELSELKTTPVAATPPNLTPVTPVNPEPDIVTVVPPANGPNVGEMDVTAGPTTVTVKDAVALLPCASVELQVT